ncbi:homoserine kinase [Secundilactobacillus odoratitofui DSM 19909 = JCM 15043]|uniref:Homoserine kinase n=1 Tax=Secundilactobacillus odoratitofui DSM 19909 = JCM 15043 TaxID=1423776 RepID=A0A0R1LX01_9LACO|nr:homoserine kinase [Secundilactobacillus odoratitofui]KRK99968.1 homoserine kinase [Secundilactobacillus odoratitofui DSM 19909 = JCM 15043]
MGKIIVRVPATSANLGPGFDSIGVAFHLYLTVIVEEATNQWRVNHALGSDVPNDERNLIVQAALKVNPKLSPHQLTVMSDIPVARGLGSSSTAIVAGVKIANALGEMNLSLAQQVTLATKMEGHPDNVAPAILGDVVVADFDGETATTVKLSLPDDLKALAFIKKQPLLTSESRGVLADTLPRQQAILGSSVANLLVAALATGDWATASQMMERDQFHENARTKLVPELPVIREAAHQLGIFGTYLSGAGPTIATFGTEAQLIVLRQKLTDMNLLGSLRIFDIDRVGATVNAE